MESNQQPTNLLQMLGDVKGGAKGDWEDLGKFWIVRQIGADCPSAVVLDMKTSHGDPWHS